MIIVKLGMRHSLLDFESQGCTRCSSVKVSTGTANISKQNKVLPRRSLLHGAVGIVAPWLPFSSSSKADSLKDLAKKVLRPEIDFSTALVMMLDARGFLLEMQVGYS